MTDGGRLRRKSRHAPYIDERQSLAHRDLDSRIHVRNAAESRQTGTDVNDPKATSAVKTMIAMFGEFAVEFLLLRDRA
jgi:hypothetical protein